MKKWVRNTLCLLLVMVLMGICLSPVARAENGVSTQNDDTKVEITGIAAVLQYGDDNSYLCEMYLYTDRSWTDAVQISVGQKIKMGDTAYDLYGMVNASWYADKVLCFQHFYSNYMDGNVVVIPAGTKFTNGGITYEIKTDFKCHKENGTWKVYEGTTEEPTAPSEPAYTDVTIKGVVLQIPGYLYLNVGLTSGNANYTTEAVTVTNSAQTETKISAIALEGGNLLIPWTASEGDILKLAKDGTVVDSSQNTGLKFLNEYVLQYNGSQWETYVAPDVSETYSYVDVELSGIYVQGGNDLYLTTGIADTHPYNGVSFSTTDILVYKPDGSTDKITNISMHPDSGQLFVAFSYPVEEGLGIHIPKNGIAVNTAQECGIKFTNEFSLFYTNGRWVADNAAPVIAYRGEAVNTGSLYGLRLGMTQAEVEALFTAEDAVQGQKPVVFTYPAGMFGSDSTLQAGTFEMKVSASDNSGNVAEHTIRVKGYSKDAPTIAFEGAAEREVDAGQVFDTASLKASAKDGNGKELTVKFSYSEGALDGAGALNKGSHKLYLTAEDDEGQSFTKAITLNCYVFTNIKVTGFYYFAGDELYISTNMKDPAPFSSSWLTSDHLLINDKSGVIPWVAVDQNSGSLYILCEKHAGDIMTIAEGATFVDEKNFVGIRVENNFNAHTDGIGWIVDRVPRRKTASSTSSPATGESIPWVLYVGVCVAAAGMMLAAKKKKQYE